MALAERGELPGEMGIGGGPPARVQARNDAARARIGSQQFHRADPKAARLPRRAEQQIFLERPEAGDLQVRPEPSPHLVGIPVEPLRDELDGSRAHDGRAGCLGIIRESTHSIPAQLHRASKPLAHERLGRLAVPRQVEMAAALACAQLDPLARFAMDRSHGKQSLAGALRVQDLVPGLEESELAIAPQARAVDDLRRPEIQRIERLDRIDLDAR